jgi:hypothetical protein
VRRAFARNPICAELLDEWTAAVGEHGDVSLRYDVTVGSATEPVDLIQDDRPRPTPSEIRARYERSLAKFPELFDLGTLYGESSGAAMRKRVRIVRELTGDDGNAASKPPPELGRENGAGAIFEGRIESLGCKLSPDVVRAGGEVMVECWWRGIGRPTRPYWTFLHIVDKATNLVFQDDHPALGFRATTQLDPGEVVRDATFLTIPEAVPPGSYRLYFGLWKEAFRPNVTPQQMNDGTNRVPAGRLEVTR